MHGNNLIILSGILVAGFACQWLAWRVKLPSILFLLVAGIVVGPVLGLLNPDAVFGDLLEPFVSLAVAIILYEGSLTLKRQRSPESCVSGRAHNLARCYDFSARSAWLGLTSCSAVWSNCHG